MPPILAQVVLATALAVGAAPLPYGYYTLLRWVACIGFAWLAVGSWSAGSKAWPWAFGLLAIVFNPIAKVHLTKGTWAAVDLAAGAVVACHAIFSWHRSRR